MLTTTQLVAVFLGFGWRTLAGRRSRRSTLLAGLAVGVFGLARPSWSATDAGAADGGSPQPAFATSAFVAYVEWVIDVRLSAAQADEAAGLVREVEASANTDDRWLVTRAVELDAERVTHSQQELASLRWSVEDEYLKMLRSRYRASKVSRWILRIKADGTRPIAPGKPLLTRHAADCLAELSAFVVAQALGADASTFAPARDAFARQLIASYPRLSQDEKTAVAAVPTEWARVRAWWAAADGEQRDRFREAWRGALAPDAGVDPKTLVVLAPSLALKAPAWR